MARRIVGISLKMYFGHARATDWFDRVASLASAQPAVMNGAVEVFVTPTFLQVPAAVRAFAGTPVRVGGQDVAAEAEGAYTGEVSASELAEVGAGLAEIGHAERRRLFGENDADAARKVARSLEAGLEPLLCIGESEQQSPEDAAKVAVAQLEASLAGAPDGSVIVAYEPVWAIGAPEPAGEDHVRVVAGALRAALAGRPGSAVIYGGAAKPGLLTRLGDAVDGVFLGRFAHDPDALMQVINEAAS
ncbi:triosephosphate isomerase [Microbacterium sorbitolivorans]|uniref:Triosephosphate isomerase n=1 Tax=Microbacterium sorbitolivorans TaxID=1867410 RepID=A0A367XXY3_9MICO|nr:triose-phosphate isomerase family protein [Microbacterium sorbitolivorans]RCK58259.1 triosephosphate isomerase [Microbacterium sorbitolivorans]GGF38797.1 triosephosphate isomerase [Microbacterium sorbitolivorans]